MTINDSVQVLSVVAILATALTTPRPRQPWSLSQVRTRQWLVFGALVIGVVPHWLGVPSTNVVGLQVACLSSAAWAAWREWTGQAKSPGR